DLLDTAVGPGHATPIDPIALTARLPANTAVVYYASLEKTLLTWVIRQGGIDAFQRPLLARDLTADVASFRSAIEHNRADEVERLSRRLYEELIGDLRTALSGQTTLLFIPDGPLNLLPFGALKDPLSSRYLVEDHATALAPSATLLARAKRMPSQTMSS